MMNSSTEDKSTESNPQSNPITVALVDDHPLVRHALRNLIESNSSMKIVAEAGNGNEAILIADKFKPDVMIMDIGMPVMNGLEATRKIKAQHPNIAVLVLTVHTDKEHILGIFEAGAAGYLTKVVFGQDIIKAIQAVVSGEAVLTQSILQQILTMVKRETKLPNEVKDYNLTPREIEILKLASKGWSNKNIALKLNLTESTIKSYFVAIFTKMNVGSRTEAVICGLKSGLMNLSDLE
jgi:DNA-binding NarL/FixJ family response regulator